MSVIRHPMILGNSAFVWPLPAAVLQWSHSQNLRMGSRTCCDTTVEHDALYFFLMSMTAIGYHKPETILLQGLEWGLTGTTVKLRVGTSVREEDGSQLVVTPATVCENPAYAELTAL